MVKFETFKKMGLAKQYQPEGFWQNRNFSCSVAHECVPLNEDEMHYFYRVHFYGEASFL